MADKYEIMSQALKLKNMLNGCDSETLNAVFQKTMDIWHTTQSDEMWMFTDGLAVMIKREMDRRDRLTQVD